MIRIDGLTKRFGDRTAVDGLTFTVESGRVTGFLGPNGAGKSTTMRMILGLDRPDAGSVTVNGHDYVGMARPMHEVGALLDARALHPRRTARDHLLCIARSNGIPGGRVDEVLELVGLESVARKRAGDFSLGMSQRLGIAVALLGDPKVLLFDEPVNGLDPEGIKWIRELMRGLAGENRTVLVSSHLMSEMAQTADHLVIIGRGRLIADIGISEFVRQGSNVLVRADDPDRLVPLLAEAGGSVRQGTDGSFIVIGLEARQVGKAALAAGIVLTELTPQRSLEQAYMDLTRDSVEFQASAA
ncbi:multidrug ABC transporter ATP-binding protein [Planomonospora parontospora subsp. parontospora]|uniref:Multidrug ABC transporter ATP-binding protein n=2 Tax=Planomonospora parontospora TaxID=58119 RepID=A0AA37F3Y4_9ACTN|nr:ABC transporter ATP-binding protein [Planomonospora parontospora]GGK61271.1 multidrug ABC transporter ATP-binding protein [Planomonospora parontospora]GII08678.1 multidrug ABC transporter ATP-binding protein [Planomonospora parontospora subsp. parontospora]